MKKIRRPTEVFAFLGILFFANLIGTNAQINSGGDIFTLQAGTEIYLRMDNEIGSKVSSVNDTFTATVSKAVSVRGMEILPVGAVVEGRIIKVEPAAFGKKNGRFEVKFEMLRLIEGGRRAIDADLITARTAKSSFSFSPIVIIGGTAIGALLGGIAGGGRGTLIGAGLGGAAGTSAAFLKKGKEARITANEEFGIRLNKIVRLPVEDF